MAPLKSALAVLAMLIVAGTAARAEGSPMPEEIAWKLLELGRVIDPPQTAALYAPLQAKEPYPASRSSAMSNTEMPTAICSMSSRRRRRPRHARC